MYDGEWETNLAGKSLVSLDAPKLHVKPCGSDRKAANKSASLEFAITNEVN